VVMWVPFRMEDEVLGAMRLGECSNGRTFGEDELSFASALGEHAAIALNNARLYAQIEDLAMTDGLTGLMNHRCFYDRLSEEIDRGRRCGTSVALLMLDIDDFKKLNDTYGHPVGDEVLRRIGALLKEECRKGGDVAARYGGEEFCVILPDTSLRQEGSGEADDPRAEPGACLSQREDAARAAESHEEGTHAVAERLRRRIASTGFPVGPDHAAVTATVSIGIASFPDSAHSMDELVACADAALYAAKRAGKDRVCTHGPG
jgi:PleD family two-component response regulator